MKNCSDLGKAFFSVKKRIVVWAFTYEIFLGPGNSQLFGDPVRARGYLTNIVVIHLVSKYLSKRHLRA